jgi:hypothetical protein
MRLTWKRIAALLLGVVLCALLGPAVLAADEEEPAALEFAVSDWDGPSNDELLTEYVRGMFYGPSRPMIKSPGSLAQTLGPVKYAIEQRFKAMIEEVAAGQRTNTQFEVYASELNIADADFSELTTDDMDTIYYALLSDCSASLYWHDVRLGRARGVGSDYAVIYFKVAADYQGSEYEVDPSRITAANAALENAREILEAYRSVSDVNKLRGYMYEICLRNVYNDDAAASSGSPSIGIDPWQLVYVFDNDPDTNVVCEGYSKAFEYLCNNTAFSSGLINCYCVSGYARVTDGVPDTSSGHMWNIVRMDDGDNYVVDVTWSDSESGSVTDYGMLLSYAKEGSLEAGYRLSRGSGSASVRQYKSNMSLYYTDSELTVCDHAYAGSHTHTADAPVQENVIASTCTAAGSCDLVTYCSRCGHEMSRETGVVLPALGHVDGEPVHENETEATCTADGGYDLVTRCTRCGEIVSSEHAAVPALGHVGGKPVEENHVSATCTEAAHHDEVVYCSVCQSEIRRTPVTEGEPLGHDYAYDPDGWSWNGYTAAAASFVCTHDSSHKETAVASISSERTEPTCSQAGSVVYTATVVYGGTTYTDTVSQVLEKLAHTPGAAVEEHYTAATCTEAAHHDEVVYCSVCQSEISRTPVTEGEPLGHDYAYDPDGWSWNGYTAATASFVCTHDSSHKETAVASISSERTEPTCSQAGSIVYTATVVYGGTTYTDTVSQVLEKLAHTPGTAVEEHYTAATCTEAAHHDEVVYCSVCQSEISRTPVTEGEPLGHDYAYDPDGWSWNGYTAAAASFVCTHDSSHKETVPATITSERTEPSVGVAGKVVYTATVDYKGNSYTDTRTEILPALPAPTVTAPQITSQPANVKAVVNKTATFSVAAQGTGLHYQWYVQTKGSTAWAPVGGDSARLTVTAAAALDGARYRCVVTGEGGKTATSNEVALTVVTAPKITAQPKKASVKAGKKVTFKVKASGYDLTYQWYYQKPGAKKWVKIKNAVKPSYSFKAGRSKNGYKYRCYVTNPAGTVKSKTAKLTVK